MSEYNNLLEQAKLQVNGLRDRLISTAKRFIPKMYSALRNENPHITPEEARDRIEIDCIGIWSKRTILDVLPVVGRRAR